MANSRKSGEYYEYAVVDTAPGAAGYWTNIVQPRKLSINKLFFSIRMTDKEDSSAASENASATVTLQFKCVGDADWTDYYNDGNDFEIGQREVIDAYAGGVSWRAGVYDKDYTSGSITFGFDW